MATTALFVEILIIGLEALVWLGLLVDIGWDVRSCFETLENYKEYSALITTLLFVSAYVIGIFIDRAADSFYKEFQYSHDKPLPAPVGEMRLKIMKDSEGISKFLDYQRSRLRIARATVFNLFVTILVGSIWLKMTENSVNPRTGILLIGLGIIILVLFVTATRRVDEAYINRLIEAYEIITEKEGGQ